MLRFTCSKSTARLAHRALRFQSHGSPNGQNRARLMTGRKLREFLPENVERGTDSTPAAAST